jgi:hypothetical protein
MQFGQEQSFYKGMTGLSSLFIMLAEKTPQTASATERAWLRALTAAPFAPQI